MAKIGRYEIVEELGKGEMASVYLARDPFIKREVAIKVLAYELTQDPLFIKFFYQEAEAIASLEHPTIVPIYDFGLHGVQPYIVMRYMPNGSLKRRLKRRGLNRQELCDLMGRLAEGLDEAHALGIVHRDVKPSNIMFNQTNDAFLTDFGLAKFTRRKTGMTGVLLVGTPEYMSPEQAQRLQVDGRSDVYALGVILYLILTGKHPFRASSPSRIASAHINAPIPSVQAIIPELPGMWDEIIGRAMAKLPEARYENTQALARDVALATRGQWHLRAVQV
ncbi:serine/threonine-protein kinase [Candidatus Leptofilum sp.]|uniref:serine/threonine-protein kinase n=1 Tax=Candidatus Leptofilum sp. TaxID=3241576 RepID=UPI003B598F0A